MGPQPFGGICAGVPEFSEAACLANFDGSADAKLQRLLGIYGVEAPDFQVQHYLSGAVWRRAGYKLCGVRPVDDGSRPRRLESAALMEFAVRPPVRLRLAAEVEVRLSGVAEGPPAVACLKARHRLSFGERDNQVIGPERYRQALSFFHGIA